MIIFIYYYCINKPVSVSLTDSEIASIGKGDACASICYRDAEIPTLLKDFPYVPGLGKRLLAIFAFTEFGATVFCQESLCSIIVNEKLGLSSACSNPSRNAL